MVVLPFRWSELSPTGAVHFQGSGGGVQVCVGGPYSVALGLFPPLSGPAMGGQAGRGTQELGLGHILIFK